MLDADDLALVNTVFRVYDQRDEGDVTYLFGEPLADSSAFYGQLYAHFARKRKTVQVEYRLGEFVVAVRPKKKDPVWLNVLLAVATFATTTFMGATLYGVNPFATPLDLWRGLPFSVAIMLVLGSHELGHYFVSRRHGIDATLPYFIPMPLPPIGTMGAVIQQKGPIPTRRALFDVGISGPLVGLAVSIVVTIVGLLLPAPQLPADGGTMFQFNTPILFNVLAGITHPGAALTAVDPVAFAGWAGMLVTVLNLIPVGQLDGGHVARAVLGKLADKVSRVLPMLLMGFGIYGIVFLRQDGEIWIIWGFLTTFMSASAHPKPTDDTQPVGWPRLALAAVALVLLVLCFTPFPFAMP